MLKQAHAILKCDPRYESATVVDPATLVARPMSIEDMHHLIQPLSLAASVPQDVREQFDKARHAFVYSWFSYDLATLAEQQAYSVVEMALRMRYEADSENGRDRLMLANLLKVAQERQWLLREDFEVPSFSGIGGNLCLLDLLPRLRNELAHGSTRLMPYGSLDMIRLCFEIISNLFPASASPEGTH
jgi:hypothetical protein